MAKTNRVIFTPDEINLLIGIAANADPKTYVRDSAKSVIHKCKDVMAREDDFHITIRR